MNKIMFSKKYGLEQAVLDGRKTMTRRKIPFSIINKFGHNKFSDKSAELMQYSRYQVGEIVAIAQSYKDCGYKDKYGDFTSGERLSAGWINKMFVRADLMSHHIRITNIRVERLQDISDEDCLREGVKVVKHPSNRKDVYYAFPHQDSDLPYRTARTAFAKLIDKVSGKGTWERNPYVFVYEFEKVD